jgi:hypothetical protein
MELDINKPILWTTKGNVNDDKLTKAYPVWIENDDYIQVKFVYEIDGEVVREDIYTKMKRGMSFAGEQGG